LRQEQLAARQVRDPQIESQLAEVQERIRAYEAPKRTAPPELPKGIVQLGKKTEQGIVRLSASEANKSKPRGESAADSAAE
jgi:hypothetical protein